MVESNNKKRKKVLIVDDEPDVIEMLTYNLNKSGFNVFSERDGLSAYLALDTIRPDIIILDVMMPYMDGILMCRQLKKNILYRHIPVIFLSAANTQFVSEAALEMQEHYIGKPVRFDILIDKVNEVLNQKADVNE